MNNITFVEAARHLAGRILNTEGLTPRQRVSLVFRSVTSRNPRPEELDLLLEDLELYLKDFAGKPEAIKQLLRVGEKPSDPMLNPTELAAYTLITNTVLNLDETITQN